jgi:hypothetical protein
MSSTLTSVGMSAFSFCSPSRGPTWNGAKSSRVSRVSQAYVVGREPMSRSEGGGRTSTMRTALGTLG